MYVCGQSNAAAVGDSLVVDNKTLSDVVKGVSKLTVDDATNRAATAAAGISSASHLSTQDRASLAAAGSGSCNAALVAPVSHRSVFINCSSAQHSMSNLVNLAGD